VIKARQASRDENGLHAYYDKQVFFRKFSALQAFQSTNTKACHFLLKKKIRCSNSNINIFQELEFEHSYNLLRIYLKNFLLQRFS